MQKQPCEYVLSGGPYIVIANEYGGIIQSVGWASLKITIQNNTAIIKILCNDRSLNIQDYVVHVFVKRLAETLTPEKIECIQHKLVHGFYTIHSYNFSKIDDFKHACVEYFNTF
jgi:hypothetical protein